MAKRVSMIMPLAAIAATACVGSGDIAVRAVGSRTSASADAGGLLADGNRQLALGNAALAIEAYRKALRDTPDSVEARSGLAAAYERMGRHDLARRYHEEALAIAPANPQLYQALAGALAVAGDYEGAAAVRREGLARAASGASPSAAPAPSVTVALAEAAPVDPALLSRAQPDLAAAGVLAVTTRQGSVARLPDLRDEPAVAANAPMPVATAAAAAAPAPAVAGARLARLSPGEVALITAPGPRWTARVVAAGPRQATIRYDRMPDRAPALVLLNAARVRHLAAATRTYLHARGFRGIEIGDAPAVRGDSVVLYGPGMRGPAMRIAGQFGFTVRPLEGEAQRVTVLLGRNAAKDRGLARARQTLG